VSKTKGVILKLDFEKAYDKVHWSFLFEVLKQKNFPALWIDWIKNCIEGGKVGVNINGVHGSFFNTFKGVRQGDPLSPLLFNLVSDALGTMLDKARASGQIQGLVPHLIEGGLTHLQYADDTVIFMALDEQSIVFTKFLLYCFENMSGLKINYQKSEVLFVGGSEEDQTKVAGMLNCNIGHLPMKYLGVWVSNRHMACSDLAYVYQKVEKKLPTWQSVGLSSGGKAILIQSCLSAIPNYSMGVYLLQEEVHQKMDSARSNFFWHGPNLKRKYHMASWDLLASPKRAGGLGFTNTRVMNKCLLAKWIFKVENDEDNMCCRLLRQKYLGDRGFFSCRNRNCSQFWRSLLDIKEDVERGFKYVVGNGRKIRFWHDTWSCGCPLKIVFPHLFEICHQQDWSVRRVCNSEFGELTFRRNFGEREATEFSELSELINSVALNESRDSVRWVLEKSGTFSTSSLYNELTFTGFSNRWLMNVWKTKVPLKIRIFLWQVINDKIQSAEQLKKRNWPGPTACKMCGVLESTSHIFFRCALANFCWCMCRDALGWPFPPSEAVDIFNFCYNFSNKQTRRVLYLFGAVAWSLWLIRNEFVFQNIVIHSPNVGIFRAISFLQKWKVMNKEMEQLWIDEVIQKLNHQLSSLRPEAHGSAVTPAVA
jgi:hypothetical protein